MAGGSTLNVGHAGNYGDVALKAENRSTSLVSATAQADARTAAPSPAGSTGTASSGSTGAGNTGSNSTGTSGSGSQSVNVGMGGSVAVNVGVNIARAEIAGDATLTGANNLGLTATGNHALSTRAKAGAGGSIAITPSGAITIGVNITEASLPKGEALDIAGGLTLSADHAGSTSATADSDATGKDAGVGLSLAVNVAVDVARAELARDVTSGSGDAVIHAHTISDTSASAKAGARGAPAPPPGEQQQTADQKSSQTLNFGKSKTGSSGDKLPSDKKQTKAKTSDGSFSVGGALAVNVAVSDSMAIIASGTTLNAQGGSVTVSTSNDTDSAAKADGSTASSNIGVGAGIAVNTVIVSNKAIIVSQSPDGRRRRHRKRQDPQVSRYGHLPRRRQERWCCRCRCRQCRGDREPCRYRQRFQRGCG